jgi:Fe-Mn family superoxide dismutase
MMERRTFLKAAGSAVAVASCLGVAPALAADPAPEGAFKLAPLPYDPAALEPHIDAATMGIHHGKHHAAYVNNLNKALAGKPELASLPLHDLLAKLEQVPDDIRTIVRNNGGGHANHAMFWQIMGAPGGPGPEGDLKSAIERDFDGLEAMQEKFNAAGGKVFGSGWVFVTVDKTGALAIEAKPNQDTPLMSGKRVLFGNDVWEHAYYLKYQNKRADYLKAWWNVANWKAIADRYAAAKAGNLTI